MLFPRFCTTDEGEDGPTELDDVGLEEINEGLNLWVHLHLLELLIEHTRLLLDMSCNRALLLVPLGRLHVLETPLEADTQARRCLSTRATASSSASWPGASLEAVRTRERTAFHGKPCCTHKCHAFAAWKGSRPFGWTVQRKIIVAKAMQLGGKRGCRNEREDLGKLFGPRWGLQRGSESFPDPP